MNGLAGLLNNVLARQMTTAGARTAATTGAGGSSASSGTQAASGAGSADMSFLTAGNFFQLLTTQLSRQDPLSPMDSTQFMSELAQLSTATGTKGLGKEIAGLQGEMEAQTRLRAAGLIGHYVGTSGNTMSLQSGSSGEGAYVLPNAASKVTVTVENSAGAVVDTMHLGAADAGTHRFTWSGSGQPAGTYHFVVSAVDGSGKSITAQPLALSKVASVEFSPTQGILLAFTDQGGTMPFDQVTAVF